MVRIYVNGQLWPLFMFSLFFFLLVIFIHHNSMSTADSASLESQGYFMHDNEERELSYGIVVDAGSTGSRLFVYCWPGHSGDSRDLISLRPVLDQFSRPVVQKVSPGLSSFASYPRNASVYMRPLLDVAAQHVPSSKHAATPVFIMATAGMRLVPQTEQDAIIGNLRSELPKHYEFQILPNHVQVITGKWEGIYSWIAVNYILGRFHRSHSEGLSTTREKTVGIIDMGGASVQIAFEFAGSIEKEHDHLVQTVNLGCRDEDTEHSHQLYVTTFLGFGVNEALKKYEQSLAEDMDGRNDTVRDPCMPVNLVKTVTFDDRQFARKGVGDWDACFQRLRSLLAQKRCGDPPCFFAGVHRPPQSDLSAAEIFGFSEYWYSLHDVLSLGGLYDFNQTAFRAREFCRTRWSVVQQRMRKRLYPNADEQRVRTQCFKSAWISAVLHEGFKVPKDTRTFKTAFTIKGQEVQWALGAMLYNTRYFPLREMQRKDLLSKRRQKEGRVRVGGDEWSSGVYELACLAVILVSCLAFCHYCFLSGKRSPAFFSASDHKLPRNQSLWGYMMLNQNDLANYSTNVRVEQSDYVY